MLCIALRNMSNNITRHFKNKRAVCNMESACTWSTIYMLCVLHEYTTVYTVLTILL